MPEAADSARHSVAAAARPDAETLRAALVDAVLAVPGVVRLEPTLSTAGPAALLHPDSADGIRLLSRAGVVELDLNIATAATHQARATTHRVQASVTDALNGHGYTPGQISISVLAITPTSTSSPSPDR